MAWCRWARACRGEQARIQPIPKTCFCTHDVRNLPTSLRVAFALRQLLEDPDTDLAQVEDLLSAEPVLASALIRAANAATYGSPMLHPSVRTTIQKLGFSAARVLAIALAVQQISAASRIPARA